MAHANQYKCGTCGREIVPWSDGNPYYLDETGAKHYAYHPDHERLAQCIGKDSPHLCLTWGEEFSVDSRASTETCPKCGADEIVEKFHLEGRRCPSCKTGSFVADPDHRAIS